MLNSLLQLGEGSPGNPAQPLPATGWLQYLPCTTHPQAEQSQTQECASSQHSFIKNNYKKLQVTIVLYNPTKPLVPGEAMAALGQDWL